MKEILSGLWATATPNNASLERRTFVDWCWNWINGSDPGKLTPQDLTLLLDTLNARTGLRCLLSLEDTDGQNFTKYIDTALFTQEQFVPSGRLYFSIRRRTFNVSNRSVVVVVASRNVAEGFMKRVEDSTRWRQQIGGF